MRASLRRVSARRRLLGATEFARIARVADGPADPWPSSLHRRPPIRQVEIGCGEVRHTPRQLTESGTCQSQQAGRLSMIGRSGKLPEMRHCNNYLADATHITFPSESIVDCPL